MHDLRPAPFEDGREAPQDARVSSVYACVCVLCACVCERACECVHVRV